MNRIARKKAVPVGELIKDMIRVSGLTPRMDSRRIFAAWDNASGAGPYTIRKFFRDGKLYITVDSSVVRSQLLFQHDALREKINSMLFSDELFSRSGEREDYVKELIIK